MFIFEVGKKYIGYQLGVGFSVKLLYFLSLFILKFCSLGFLFSPI